VTKNGMNAIGVRSQQVVRITELLCTGVLTLGKAKKPT